MDLDEAKVLLVKLPGTGVGKAITTAVTSITLSAYLGQMLTFRASGAKIWWAAGPATTGFTVATASSLFLNDGDRHDALITRDRIVLKLKGAASCTLKYAVTG